MLAAIRERLAAGPVKLAPSSGTQPEDAAETAPAEE